MVLLLILFLFPCGKFRRMSTNVLNYSVVDLRQDGIPMWHESRILSTKFRRKLSFTRNVIQRYLGIFETEVRNLRLEGTRSIPFGWGNDIRKVVSWMVVVGGGLPDSSPKGDFYKGIFYYGGRCTWHSQNHAEI